MPPHFSVQHIIVIWIGCVVQAQNPDIGKILIGNQGNRTDPAEYKFNRNVNSAQPFRLPFSAVVYSGTNGSDVPKMDTISVTCQNDFETVEGYTKVTFVSQSLPDHVQEGSIEFRVTGEGRAAVVHCYGVSEGHTCPANNNRSIAQPQFCMATSMSDPISIILTPAPVVSICQRDIILSSPLTSRYNGELSVTLSEPVQNSSVTVTCTSDNSAITCSQGNAISFGSSVTVDVTRSTATISYNISGSSAETCVGLICRAQSATMLSDGYYQFQTATSFDGSSRGQIRSVLPSVMMEPKFSTVYNTSFQSLLYTDMYTSVNIPFQCQASVVSSLEEALQRVASPVCSFTNGTTTATTTPTTTTTTSTTTMTTTTAPSTTDVNVTMDANATTASPPTLPPTPPPDPNSPWVVVNSSFIVSPSSRYFVVQTSRQRLVIAAVQEIIVTTCCAVTATFQGLSVVTVTVANLKPIRNSTGGVTSGDPRSERFVVKPAFREVAPCSCDLTYLSCDVNCCCDEECTEAEKETFSGCIPGRPGGLDPGPDLRSCKSNHFPQDDWFPAMCVQFESNALLGQFYSNTNKLTTVFNTNSKLDEQQKSNTYTYRKIEARFSDLTVIPGYTYGSNILTISSQGNAGNLPLPQRTSSGQCLDSIPVQFLLDSDSTCVRILTQESCRDLTPFSAHQYLQSSSLYSPACPKPYAVSSTGRSLQDETQRVDVQVNYYCTQSSTSYYKTLTEHFSSLVSPNTVYSFSPGLENFNCTDTCGIDSECLQYNVGLGTPNSNSSLPRCPNDTSYFLPGVPELTGNICRNVVLEVRYHFTWTGQEITELTADVLLGDVVVASGSEVIVSQRFTAVFMHDYSGPSNQSDNYQQLTTSYQRSGRPGYDFGKPVATGCNSTNASTGESLPIDQSPEKQMAIWNPGVDGLCQNAKRQYLTFGDNMQSSCILHLTISEIQNCNSLKHVILSHLNVLMPSNVIGRYGYSSPDIDAMWINILRQDPFTTEEAPTTTTTATTTTTTEVNITNDNVTDTPPVPTTVSVQTTTENSPQKIVFDPLSLRRGYCQDVVSGIHLEILYAETGQNNGYPLREIIGASIKYSVSNWSMACTGANSARCQNNGLFTQPFTVSSSVQFIQVSATRPEQPVLFYEINRKDRCDSDTCYRFFEDFDTSVCHYDTCWHEFFYPLTQSYRGYESISYTRAFSLLFLLFIIGYFAVAKPWK